MSEHDLETLEVWLDGELSEEQIEALRRRLSLEPQLMQTLDRLRSDRQLRAGFFQTLEPGGAETETLVANARKGVRREEMINSRLRALRNVSGIAASIAFVFMAGWLGHGRLTVGAQKTDGIVQVTPVSGVPIVNPGRGSGTVEMPRISPGRQGPAGTVMVSNQVPVDTASISLNRNLGRPLYSVRVTDPFGRVVFDDQLQALDDLKRLPELILAADQAQQGVAPSPGNRTMQVNQQNALRP